MTVSRDSMLMKNVVCSIVGNVKQNKLISFDNVGARWPSGLECPTGLSIERPWV